jgi:transposase
LEVEDRVVGDLLEVLHHSNPTIAELTRAIEQQAEKCPEAQRLMTHPGVGALTAIAFVLIIGVADRFGCGKQIASYLGLVPEGDSSRERRRLGQQWRVTLMKDRKTALQPTQPYFMRRTRPGLPRRRRRPNRLLPAREGASRVVILFLES